MNAPLDETHRMSAEFIRQLRARLHHVHRVVDRWQPRPCPPDWRPQR